MSFSVHPLWMKRKAQVLVERLFGYRVYVYPRPTSGHQDFADLHLLGCPPRVIFDVGANIGQSAFKFRAAFPQAEIHCFEPVSATFATLVSNVRGMDVTCHQLALAARPGTSTIYLTEDASTSSMVAPARPRGSETVTVTTVDAFCAAGDVTRIDLLKVDAEGFDVDVLLGAKEMLKSGRIAFVETEVTFNAAANRGHASFDAIRSVLDPAEFDLLGVYDQILEWSGERRMQFANALFVHRAVAEAGNPRARDRKVA